MGLFGKSKKSGPAVDWPSEESEAESLKAREVKLTSGDLANLLDTAGGSYIRTGPPDLINGAAKFVKSLPLDERSRWEGVAWLYRGESNGYDVVNVVIKGTTVSKLTKESVASIWEKLESPVPVRCALFLLSPTMPSLTLYANKS